jgi:hypothetical protein
MNTIQFFRSFGKRGWLSCPRVPVVSCRYFMFVFCLLLKYVSNRLKTMAVLGRSYSSKQTVFEILNHFTFLVTACTPKRISKRLQDRPHRRFTDSESDDDIDMSDSDEVRDISN